MSPTRSLLFRFAKDVLLPLLAALVAWGAASMKTDRNHARSAKGYETVAVSLNLVLAHLDDLERRMDRLERTPAPASQPTAALPAPPPYHAAALLKAPAKFPPAAKAPPAPTKRPPAAKRVPERLGAF